MSSYNYSLEEEIGNTATHVLGSLICAFLFGVFAHITFQDSSTIIRDIGCCVFGLTSIFVFVASSMYHAITNKDIKRILKKFDHIAIYFLIAGTYIPLALSLLVPAQPLLGWTFIGIQVASVCGGIAYKLLAKNCYSRLSVLIYCVMGWSVLPIMEPVWSAMPAKALPWFVYGGLFYMLGVPFYMLKQYKWMHTVWHVMVMCGIICHYMMMFYI